MNGDDATGERGSTLPLILGFFLIALLMVAGGVAATDAFVRQRALQDVCDGAAVAAAAGSGDVRRGGLGGGDGYLRFTGVQQGVEAYLARDPSRAGVRVTSVLSADGTTIRLTCEQTSPIAFGAMFGKGGGVHHVAHASARSRLSS
ncbi:MAG: hypothetical protein EPN43_14455 [Jatrophihabitans sp.]|nr:MAG: hypothetical protein EPN43_14455 [Jatrophihabitans sp.]